MHEIQVVSRETRVVGPLAPHAEPAMGKGLTRFLIAVTIGPGVAVGVGMMLIMVMVLTGMVR